MSQKREKSRSDLISEQLGQKLLQGWTMLGECCPNPECPGVPLMREKATRKMLCVACNTTYVVEADAPKAVAASAAPAPAPVPAAAAAAPQVPAAAPAPAQQEHRAAEAPRAPQPAEPAASERLPELPAAPATTATATTTTTTCAAPAAEAVQAAAALRQGLARAAQRLAAADPAGAEALALCAFVRSAAEALAALSAVGAH
eukprot:m51a1_g5441 hypothetical protein (202) ;mRNA; f:180525-181359